MLTRFVALICPGSWNARGLSREHDTIVLLTDVYQVTHGLYGSLLQGLGTCVGLCGAVPCCPFPNPFRNVQQGIPYNYTNVATFDLSTSLGSVGLVTRFGQFYKSVDPGLVQVNVCTEGLRIVDVKIQISPIGRQTVITRDNVNVEM